MCIFDKPNDKKMKVLKTIEAKDLKIGDKYYTGYSVQEVVKIVKISDKTIEFRTNRIYPDFYQGNFFQRPRLTTKFKLV